MLLAGRRTPAGSGTTVVQRYRLARARIEGRPTSVAQRSESESARSSRSASLFMP